MQSIIYIGLLVALAAEIHGHGVVTQIQGANGVNMPGLSVIDGTPRDCASPGCGAEADTSIIRENELGSNKASALGRTNGGGPVDAASAISMFMTGSSSSSSSGKRGLLDGLLGGNNNNNGGSSADGTSTRDSPVEGGVKTAAGTGSKSGLPTCSDNGTISMTFHQVNQDGAGSLTAMIDPTSGGTDASAFQKAEVTQDVPGNRLGLSSATTMDFPIKVQMPEGMTCSGNAGGASNVCIVRVNNNALAGPFGGSAAFTMSHAAKKRAVEFNLAKRHMARGILKRTEVDSE
ncbi:putative cell surface protein Mas1 [Talaromyces proteolyticus]|uniref:Cell surface protein Mas1 n=1 Tax=Talaromyces proteolyticus TaxID=1131652 RepID=A0AAD4KWF0_9EURO|nr:putative cell surface protein Mas1 [Talaromyces proteolyticus]KAH8698437.1 putative cell surface protein Mas1 [Talaromyces proteolyticus]